MDYYKFRIISADDVFHYSLQEQNKKYCRVFQDATSKSLMDADISRYDIPTYLLA